MELSKGGILLSWRLESLQFLKDLIEFGLIDEDSILSFSTEKKLTKRDIHHSIKRVAEFRNVIRSEGNDELARAHDRRNVLQYFLFITGCHVVDLHSDCTYVVGRNCDGSSQDSVLEIFFLCGIRDIMLDIEKYEFLVLGILSLILLGIISLIPKMFSCY